MFRNWFRDDPVSDAEDYAISIEEKRDEIGDCVCCREAIYKGAMEYGQYGDKYYQIEDKIIHQSCGENWLDEQPTKVRIFDWWVYLEDVDESVSLKWLDKQPKKVLIDGAWVERENAMEHMDRYYLYE